MRPTIVVSISLYLICCFFLWNCKKEKGITTAFTQQEVSKKNIQTKTQNQKVIKASIDSVSINQVKDYSDKELPNIYEYYKREEIEDYNGWSEKMFGDCCTEIDLLYSQLLTFTFMSNKDHKKYPLTNIYDTKYRTAYAFTEQPGVSIDLKINIKSQIHSYFINGYSVDKVLKETDTVMYPIKLSLINGYVKSKDLFYKNGRVKNMEVLVNGQSVGIVQLIDTPLIQEFSINALFKRDDTITLKPLTFYKGTIYDDICISEIQSNLGYITHPSINRKYVIDDLRE